jgi:hypothetical protein
VKPFIAFPNSNMTARIVLFVLLLPLAALAQLQVFVLNGSNLTAVGSSLSVGAATIGDTIETQFRVQNPGSQSVPLTVSLSGEGFTIQCLPAPYVPPGEESAFCVDFTPAIYGSFSAILEVNNISITLTGSAAATASLTAYQGTLTVDGRTFNLTGQGWIRRFPAPPSSFASTVGASAQQNSVTIPLASASQVSGTGTLTMAFQSSVTGVTDDPAIQFLVGTAAHSHRHHFGRRYLGHYRRPIQHGVPDRNHGRDHHVHAHAENKPSSSALTIPPAPINLDERFSAVRLFGSLNVSFGGSTTPTRHRNSRSLLRHYGQSAAAGRHRRRRRHRSSSSISAPRKPGESFQVLAEFPVTGNHRADRIVTGADSQFHGPPPRNRFRLGTNQVAGSYAASMLLASVVETSRRVADTSKRSGKDRLLAALIRQLSPKRSRSWSVSGSGQTRQGRIGIGYAAVRDARNSPAASPTLEILESTAFCKKSPRSAAADPNGGVSNFCKRCSRAPPKPSSSSSPAC